MNPVEVLSKLIEVDRRSAKIVLAGLGVLAAAAIVLSFQVNLGAALEVGGYIVLLGIVMSVAAFVLHHPGMRLVVGWFTLASAISLISIVLFSVLTDGRIALRLECLLRAASFRECYGVGGPVDRTEAARQLPQPAAVPQPQPPPAANVNPSDFTVSVQFAGSLARERVAAMSLRLRQQGWNVPSAELGGERTPRAAGENEVRYSGNSEAAARLLAAAVQRDNPTGKSITVQATPIVPPRTLEVWISR